MERSTFFSMKVDKQLVIAMLVVPMSAAFYLLQDTLFKSIHADKEIFIVEGQFAIPQRDPSIGFESIPQIPGRVKPNEIDISLHLSTDRLFTRGQDYKLRATLERLGKRAHEVGYPVQDPVSGKIHFEKAARVDHQYNPQETRYEVYFWEKSQDDSSRKLAITIGDGLGMSEGGLRTLRIRRYEQGAFLLNSETDATWQKLAYAIGAEKIEVVTVSVQ